MGNRVAESSVFAVMSSATPKPVMNLFMMNTSIIKTTDSGEK